MEATMTAHPTFKEITYIIALLFAGILGIYASLFHVGDEEVAFTHSDFGLIQQEPGINFDPKFRQVYFFSKKPFRRCEGEKKIDFFGRVIQEENGCRLISVNPNAIVEKIKFLDLFKPANSAAGENTEMLLKNDPKLEFFK